LQSNAGLLYAYARNRKTFEDQEWQSWMVKAGQSTPAIPSEEGWSVIKQCVEACFSQLDNILAWFVENIRDGQNLVETFNLKPSWKCQVE